jgi:membrane protein
VILVTGPQIARALDLWGTAEVVWNLVQLPLSLLLVVAAFWACYYILPARDQAASKSETLQGAAVATLLWVIATLGFRFYIANFASYADTYGFIGGFIILLLWLYITGLVLLIGGELASALEQRSAG